MSELTLTLGGRVIVLNFGAPLPRVEPQFAHVRYSVSEDEEIDRIDLEALDSGIDLVFKAGALSAVFLFIVPENPEDDGRKGAPFAGTVSVLPDDFFAEPTPGRFRQSLSAKGFTEWPQKLANAIDMVSDGMRARYTADETATHVLFDDGQLLQVRGRA